MKNTFLLLLLFALTILLSINLKSQPSQVWVSRYNTVGNTTDRPTSLVLDKFGNVYVTGESEGSGTGFDYATVKYNSSGVQQWVSRYTWFGSTEDKANAIFVDTLGNVYITGESDGSGTGKDYCTIKYNSSGVQQWVQRYNGIGNGTDRAVDIAVDRFGNVIVTGSISTSVNIYDIVSIKYNSNGDSIWVKRYGFNSIDVACALVTDSSGNIYITGSTNGFGTNDDFVTLKYNPNGDSIWVKRYNGIGNGDDRPYDIILDVAGNSYITGGSIGTTTGNDYATVKYNSSGIQQWVARYSRPGNLHDVAHAVNVDNAGNIYVTGQSNNSISGIDIATIRYSPSGVQQWVQIYNEPSTNGFDDGFAIEVDSIGNVFVAGISTGNTGIDYVIIKYNNSGVQSWVQRYNGTGANGDYLKSMKMDKLGNIYITGYSFGTSNYDYTTIKYSQMVGVKPISNDIPNNYNLAQNYPNPFNPTTKIKFNIAKTNNTNSYVKLVVFDILGREIETLVNDQLQSGTYEIVWDATNYSSGVYCYELITGEFRNVRKMILIK